MPDNVIVTDSKLLWRAAKALDEENTAVIVIIARPPADDEDSVDFELGKTCDNETALMVLRCAYQHARQEHNGGLSSD